MCQRVGHRQAGMVESRTGMAGSNQTYTRFTPRMALNMAAPHTWPASILPTLVGVCAAAAHGPVSSSMALVLLAIAVLMQSAVNTFNDYCDYVKGTDDDEAFVDPTDAVLVYNDVDPRAALRLAIGFLAAAFLLGIYAIVAAGWVPLVIALVGALFVVLYSAGKSPISYLPLGEAASGIVMGALIPLAVYDVLAGSLDFMALVWGIPTVIGVGLIMFTNNTCDIERDALAKRRTLPVLLGRARAVSAYRATLIIWAVSIIVIVAVWFTPGLIVVPFMALASYPQVKALFDNPFTSDRRLQAMPQILSANITFGAFYAASMLAAPAMTLIP